MDRVDKSKKDTSSQLSREIEKKSPPRPGMLHCRRRATSSTIRRLRQLISYQILPRYRSKLLAILIVRTSRRLPMQILPNRSLHHLDLLHSNSNSSPHPKGEITSQPYITANTRSSRIFSNSLSAIHRRKHLESPYCHQ